MLAGELEGPLENNVPGQPPKKKRKRKPASERNSSQGEPMTKAVAIGEVTPGRARLAAAAKQMQAPPQHLPGSLEQLLQAFVDSTLDPSVPKQRLSLMFDQLLRKRDEQARLGAQMPDQTGRAAVLNAIVELLRCVEGHTLQLSTLASDPSVTAVRKGVVRSLLAFVRSCPEHLELVETCNSRGNTIQMVRLAGAAEVQKLSGPELLIEQVTLTLRAMGGSASVSQLGQDAAIRDRAKGVAAKLSKFLSAHSELFSVVEDEKGILMCRLLDLPELQTPGVADGEGQLALTGGNAADQPVEGTQAAEQLMETVVSLLQSMGGALPLPKLALMSDVKEKQKGVTARLSTFLLQFPQLFSIKQEGANGPLIVRLLAA
mmetsp:Transcript_11010/g.25880  ORF Transcript_11010/g.25880 Transcript_11010/m.25880 type:complete len:374 (-) Transcript_11010:106-1227(-)